jgi:SAM-dependent methyltransferase
MAQDILALNRLALTGKRGKVLVVGSRVYKNEDRRKLYHTTRDSRVVGLDMIEGEGVDIVHDFENPLPDIFGKFDHIDCVSTLEHCKRPWKMAANMEKALVKDGTILISVPFVWRVHDYPGDYWRMTPDALDIIFPHIEWIERGFLIGGEVRKLVRGLNTEDGGIYMQRAETVGIGRKCSTS